jgi:hypothetical protein
MPSKLVWTAGALFGSIFTLAGCEAYNKVAYGVLDNANVTTGSVKVVNTMSVPICGVTMVPDGGAEREGEDLQGKELGPGAEGTVSFPFIGKPSENPPQPEKWSMRVYGCEATSAYEKRRGSLLATIPDVSKNSSQPVAIR